jgi:hypothetical protein
MTDTVLAVGVAVFLLLLVFFASVRIVPESERGVIFRLGRVIAAKGPGLFFIMRRFQQRAEDRWEANAAKVADRLVRLVDGVRPRAVVVTGDVRAVQFLRDKSPTRVTELMHEVQGEYGSPDEVIEQAVQVVHRLVCRDVDAALEEHARESGRAGRATAGVSDTLAVLARGQAATVLLRRSPATLERPVWVGTEPGQLGASRDEVAALGAVDPVPGPLGDAVARTALATGARVVLVPTARTGTLPDGVGAVLRFTA